MTAVLTFKLLAMSDIERNTIFAQKCLHTLLLSSNLILTSRIRENI